MTLPSKSPAAAPDPEVAVVDGASGGYLARVKTWLERASGED